MKSESRSGRSCSSIRPSLYHSFLLFLSQRMNALLDSYAKPCIDCFLWQDQPDTGYLIEGIEVGCESRCNLQIIHSLIFLASFANLKPAMHCMSQYTLIHLLAAMILDHSKYYRDTFGAECFNTNNQSLKKYSDWDILKYRYHSPCVTKPDRLKSITYFKFLLLNTRIQWTNVN